ncbi:MAG: chromate efflux transporter [Serpentinimonas sp.]|nr:chromate efflux transporter [Serpentinimonas sp.]
MPADAAADRHPWAVFLVFLRLGLTSFGGPIAHLAYFRTEFVQQRRWLDEHEYASLVALCQFLPGPASSQVGFALGWSRAGYQGALAAWCGFTLPSALLLVAFAYLLLQHGQVLPAGLLPGLVLAALAVVAQAVWGMGRSLCPDTPRRALALLAAVAVLLWPGAWALMGVIVFGALIGRWGLAPVPPPAAASAEGAQGLQIPVSRRLAWGCLAVFVGALALWPLWAWASGSFWVALVEVFYRSGALVFGGGHVVLPMLQAEVVPSGWVDLETFLAGYAAAQAVPGPLFTFAAFLGAAMGGWLGAVLALLAVFAPGMLVLLAALPHWQRLRQSASAQRAMAGVNAAVVGLLLAALLLPLQAGVLASAQDVALLALAALALLWGKWPPWLVVLGCGALGALGAAVLG